MIEIEDKTKCCGCTACSSVCPKRCIAMIEDEEGFLYPKVDKSRCINCDACQSVCPIINKSIQGIKESTFSFGVQSKSMEERMNCTAGGFVTLFSRKILEEGGKVFGCTYEKMHVVHKEGSTEQDLNSFRGSKYVQSNLQGVYSEIKRIVKRKETVLFIGTGCQVHGLKKCIGESDHLFTIDLLCLGVSSPMLFERWVKYLENKYRSKVSDIQFRNKKYGYSVPNVRIVFSNGKILEQKYDSRVHSKLFFRYYNVRPSCYECLFREIPRCSDITVGDFHNVREYSKKLDDDTGVTQIWIHTQKGQDMFEKIKDSINFVSVSNSISNIVGGVSRQIICPKDRNAFFEDARNMSYNDLISKWQPKSFKDDISSVARRLINVLPFKRIINKEIKNVRISTFRKGVRKANE